MKKKVLFVGDGGDPAALAECLVGDGMEIIAHIRPLSWKLGAIGRHFGYFRLALVALRHRPQSDCILIWQQFVAMYYCFLMAFLPRARPIPIILYYIIYKKPSNRLVNWLKHGIMRSVVNSRHVAVSYFLSRSDYLYGEADSRKRKLLVHCPFRSQHIEKNTRLIGTVGEFFFSGGASNRDYSQIRRLAEQLPDARFRVASLPSVRNDFTLFPPNVRLYFNIYGDDFEDLILKSKAVVIPLADPVVTSGQLVIMAAMQAGKTVFISRNSFVDEWVAPDLGAGFLFQYDSVAHLSALLAAATDPDLAAGGKRAREFFLAHSDDKVIYRSFAEQLRAVSAD